VLGSALELQARVAPELVQPDTQLLGYALRCARHELGNAASAGLAA
jgi:hypothetical protein